MPPHSSYVPRYRSGLHSEQDQSVSCEAGMPRNSSLLQCICILFGFVITDVLRNPQALCGAVRVGAAVATAAPAVLFSGNILASPRMHKSTGFSCIIRMLSQSS